MSMIEALWGKRAGGNSNALSYAIATDSNGNVYVTGYFQNSMTFDVYGGGTETLNSAGADEMFVLKYDSNGNVLWGKRLGGIGGEAGNEIAADSNGNVYVTGYFRGSMTFDVEGGGTETLTSASAGNVDIFVLKYGANGNVLWGKRVGGNDGDSGHAIATDSNGNVYVSGRFRGSMTFDVYGGGTDTLTSAGGSDIFVLKYGSNGNVLWGKCVGGIGTDGGHAIATDSNGNVYVTGYFRDSMTFDVDGGGTETLTSVGNADIFVLKYTDRKSVV